MKAVLKIRHKEDANTHWSKGAYEDIYSTEEIRHLDSFYQ